LILSSNWDYDEKIVSELAKLGISCMLVTPSWDGKIAVADQVESLRLLADNVIGNPAISHRVTERQAEPWTSTIQDSAPVHGEVIKPFHIGPLPD